MINFEGKVIALTGAASGIGAAVAELFYEHGASLVLADRDRSALQAFVGRFDAPDRVLIAQADVTKADEITTALRAGHDGFGGLDYLVPAAGIFRGAELASMTDTDWRATLTTNLDGVFHTCRAALPLLRDGGAIVNIASVAGHRGAVNYVHYSASKGAVLAFTRALAAEVAPRLRVNAVSPGVIETPMVTDLVRDRGERLLAATPMNRLGSAREVAGVIAFLCSDLASFVTGETVHVNGGLYMAS